MIRGLTKLKYNKNMLKVKIHSSCWCSNFPNPKDRPLLLSQLVMTTAMVAAIATIMTVVVTVVGGHDHDQDHGHDRAIVSR